MVKTKKITTPIGTSSWCALNEAPDTKFDPQWYCDLLVDKADAESFVADAEAFYTETREHFGASKATNPLPIKEHVDEEGNKTGKLVFKCKRKASGIRKDGSTWENKPPVLFGADLQPFTPEGSLGKGTKLRMSIGMKPYGNPKVGVTFEIVSAQIIDANYYGEEASADAFDVVEEGTAKTVVPAGAESFSEVEGGDSFNF
jgi:hypothetical protein